MVLYLILSYLKIDGYCSDKQYFDRLDVFFDTCSFLILVMIKDRELFHVSL